MTSSERLCHERIGLNLRAEMMRSGLNQVKLAHAMHAEPASVSKMLSGLQLIYVWQFLQMIRFIGTSINAILTPEIRDLAERARRARPTVDGRKVV